MKPPPKRAAIARSLAALAVVLFWFNTGIEAVRTASWDDLKANPSMVLWPPWNVLRAYVSREGDDHLYYEYTRLLLGQDADAAYIARRHQTDAESVRRGVSPGGRPRLPYRDFAFEYPPVPIAFMLAPRLVASTLPGYRVAFGALMALMAAGTALIGIRIARLMGSDHAAVAARRLVWLVLAVGPIIVSRFDMVPAFFTAAALFLWVTDRPLRAGLVLGVATMTKLYPLLLLLPWIAPALARGRDGLRDAARLAGGTALGALAVALAFAVSCPEPFVRSVFLYGARPFQIESLVGAVALAVRGRDAVTASFGSDNVRVPGALLLGWTVVLPAALAALAATAFSLERREPTRDGAARVARATTFSAAALCCILCGSKVLSPQFQAWLLPAVALLPGRRGARVWRLALAAAVLTQAFYPYLYEALLSAHPAPVALLAVRNATFVVMAAAAAHAAATSPLAEALARSAPPRRPPRAGAAMLLDAGPAAPKDGSA
jgi:hypothetical protein